MYKRQLIGAVHAGDPMYADEYCEDVFPLPSALVGRDADCFILEVRGDSMINAGIEEGDYLIVAEQETAQNGDIVCLLYTSDAADDCCRV